MFAKQLPTLVFSLALLFLLAACSTQPNLASTAAVATPESTGSAPQPTELSTTTTPQQMIAITPTVDNGGFEAGSSTRVLWRINQYVMGPAASVDEETAKTYIFKPLDISSDKIVFDGKTCQNVTFKKETVITDSFLADNWKTTQKDLGIAFPTIEVFKTSCDLPGFAEYIRLSDSRLIVSIDGVFYIFEPNTLY